MKNLLFVFLLIASFAKAQWTQQVSGTSNGLNEIFFAATDTGFAVGDNGTLLKTVNGGGLWSPQSPGTTKHLLDVFFLNTQNGFIVGDSGYFASTVNGGTTWSGQYLPNAMELGCVFFTTPLIGYVGGADNLSGGLIFKTIDGGTSWTLTNTPTSNFSINYSRLNFPVIDTGYALTRGMCMKTIDAGNNWFITDTASVNAGTMFSILEDAYFFSADTGYIVGWYNPYSGYTTNGYLWTDQFIGWNNWRAIDFPSRQTGYMIGWGQLEKTTDGGLTWWDITSSLVTTAPSLMGMDFTDNNTGYACGANGFIMKTTNGATSGIQEGEASMLHVSVFPNPVTDHCNFFFSENIKSGTLILTNILGEEILRITSINTDHITIDRSQLQSGMYFFSLSENDKTVSSGKIIIE